MVGGGETANGVGGGREEGKGVRWMESGARGGSEWREDVGGGGGAADGWLVGWLVASGGGKIGRAKEHLQHSRHTRTCYVGGARRQHEIFGYSKSGGPARGTDKKRGRRQDMIQYRNNRKTEIYTTRTTHLLIPATHEAPPSLSKLSQLERRSSAVTHRGFIVALVSTILFPPPMPSTTTVATSRKR